eukprot:TRINITY_DN11748_c0_g1_i2.p1 TRINITY_DN11748_c0_g1~~TRINITY_DN11748_c0_g1_i2.p1  ORF type:complete len:728 (-),score=152.85 TRINITY_DN11748_c0_g1_i2:35-2218(-)
MKPVAKCPPKKKLPGPAPKSPSQPPKSRLPAAPRRPVPRPSCSPHLLNENLKAATLGDQRARSRSRSRGKTTPWRREEASADPEADRNENSSEKADWNSAHDTESWQGSSWKGKDWESDGWKDKDWERDGWKDRSWSDDSSWSWKNKKAHRRTFEEGNLRDVPKVVYTQAFISDIPVEFGEKELCDLHTECGIAEEDFPISCKFLPSKDQTGETCAVIARYREDAVLQRVILKMSGHPVTTRSGRVKTVGISKAKPAAWMIKAGLAKEHEKEPVPTRVTMFNVPAESTSSDILQLHAENGLSVDDMPLVTVFEPKIPGDETCLAACRYQDISNAQKAIDKLRGAMVATRSGHQLHIGLRIDDGQEASTASPENTTVKEGVRMEGVLQVWHAERAFGFIQPLEGGHEFFVHFREIKTANPVLVPGAKVTFEALFVKERNKYEARNCVFENMPAAMPKLEMATASGPSSSEAPDEEHQKVPGLSYFCEMWEIDDATANWLGRLHPTVQEAVIAEYDDSTRLEPPKRKEDEVTFTPSSNLFVSGLPKDFGQDALLRLFGRFGTVKGIKIVPPGLSALVSMQNVQEATIAMQDLNLSVPEGRAEVICVRYCPPSDQDHSIPENKLLFGTIKLWNQGTNAGIIAINGIGPDLPVSLSAFVDEPYILNGCTVLFKATWSQELSRHVAWPVMASLENVRKRLDQCAGRGRAVRQFARNLELHMQIDLQIGTTKD